MGIVGICLIYQVLKMASLFDPSYESSTTYHFYGMVFLFYGFYNESNPF